MLDTETQEATHPRRWARVIAIQTVQLAGLLGAVLGIGFIVFVYAVTSLPQPLFRPKADAIVAMTGGEDRLAEALRLLSEGQAKRLLISGVNPTTTMPELIRFNGFRREESYLFRCCIDLDKRALNTENNATETTTWAKERGFRSLIVVTSSYHMPRTLIELRQTMPDVELFPFPVRSPTLEEHGILKRQCLRLLAKEYVKFLTASVRYAAKSLTRDAKGDQPLSRVVHARAD